MTEQYGGGLPQAPRPPEGWAVPQRGERPPSVTNAVRLMFLRVGIGIISLIVLFATKDDLKKQILDDNSSATDSTVNAALAVGAVVGIIFLLLYALLAVQVSKGRNWARIVTWVLAGLGILFTLVGLGTPAPATSRILSIIDLVIDVGIVVLLAQPTSNRYFKPLG
jgi:hypothetical protein